MYVHNIGTEYIWLCVYVIYSSLFKGDDLPSSSKSTRNVRNILMLRKADSIMKWSLSAKNSRLGLTSEIESTVMSTQPIDGKGQYSLSMMRTKNGIGCFNLYIVVVLLVCTTL